MDGVSGSAFRARIACVSPQDALRKTLTTTLSAAGYDVAGPETAVMADLGIIDFRQAEVSPRKAKAMADGLRRKSPETAILFLVDAALDAASRAALKRHGETITAGADLDHVLARCRQILRLRSIAEETGERLKSLANLNRLGRFPMITASDSAPRILIAGSPGPAAMAAINAVSPIAGECVCVLTAGQAMRALDHEPFDCALILPMTESDPMNALARALRRHPKHAGMSVIQIAEHLSDLSLYARRGAREFILVDHIPNELGNRVQLAARRGRLMRSMRVFLRACTGEGIRDASSGSFTATFLTEHGARICARADATQRAMTFLMVQICDHKNLGRHALHQAARLINRVTRAEDLVSRIAPEKFVIACPSTVSDDAVKIGLRIEGVLSSTAFRDQEDGHPYSVSVETIVNQRAYGASIEESVAELLRKSKVEIDATPPLQQSPQ